MTMNMLKKSLLLAMVGLSLAAGAANAADKAAGEAGLKAHETVWFDLYNKGDAAGLANLYATDAIVMPPGAAALNGRAAIQAFLVNDIATSKKAGVTLQLGAMTGASVSGDSGWISGTWSAVDASGAAVDGGNYLEVSHRSGKEWLIVRDTWNSDRAPPAPAADAKPAAKPSTK
jgi:ketosteroid isomerase-like protein